MHLSKCVLWRLVPAVAAALLASSPLAAQSQGTIDCTPGGHGEKCEVRLRAGQTSEVIRFRPTVPGPTKFKVDGLPGGQITVNVGADNTAPVFVTRSAAQTDTTVLLVETADLSITRRDTIRIYPFVAARTVEAQDDLATYVWIRNTWIPLGLRVAVRPVGGTQLTEDECRQVGFSLQAMPEGDVTPDTGRAIYEAQSDTSRYNCFVNARWKLADGAGEQEIAVRVGDRVTLVPGVAREGPRIVVGTGWFTKHADEDTRYCNDYGEAFESCRAERTALADSIKKTGSGSDKSVWRPFFGVEAPFLVTRQPTNGVVRWLQSSVRVVGGSTFVKPEENFFVGLTVSPLFQTELESLPLQVQAAWRLNGGFVAGLSVDGSGLLSTALKALGAPIS